jgi:hypothetical protein
MHPEDKQPPKALLQEIDRSPQPRPRRAGDTPIIITAGPFRYGHFLPMRSDGKNADHQEFPQTTEKTLAPPGAGI